MKGNLKQLAEFEYDKCSNISFCASYKVLWVYYRANDNNDSDKNMLICQTEERALLIVPKINFNWIWLCCAIINFTRTMTIAFQAHLKSCVNVEFFNTNKQTKNLSLKMNTLCNDVADILFVSHSLSLFAHIDSLDVTLSVTLKNGQI